MTLPNDAANTGPTDAEPEGIRRMREDYGPEKMEEILASIRRGADDYENGRMTTLEQYMKERGIDPEDVGTE